MPVTAEALKRLIFAPEVLAVARSLRDDAGSWNGDDHYRLVHPNGVRVWRENRAYGLHIAVGHSWLGERKVWGGVTMLSSFGLSLSHHLLNHAIKRWERRFGKDSVTERLFPLRAVSQ